MSDGRDVGKLEGSVLGYYIGSEYGTKVGSYDDMSGGELEGTALGESGTEVGSSGEMSWYH